MIAVNAGAADEGPDRAFTASAPVSASTSSNLSLTGATPVQTAVSLGSSPNPRRLSISSSLSLSSNLAEFSSFDRTSSVDLEVNPAMKVGPGNLAGAFSFSKALQDEQALTLLNDAVISYALRGPQYGRDLSTGLSLSSALPLSKDSRERDSLYTSLRVSPSIAYVSKFGRFAYKLGLVRHLHRYTTATYGRSNAEWGLSNGLDYVGTIGRSFTVSLSFSFANAWTYAGSLNQSFRMAQDLSYDLSEQLAISLGHTNNGSALKDDGQSSNIAVFNSRSSVVYTGISYTF